MSSGTLYHEIGWNVGNSNGLVVLPPWPHPPSAPAGRRQRGDAGGDAGGGKGRLNFLYSRIRASPRPPDGEAVMAFREISTLGIREG